MRLHAQALPEFKCELAETSDDAHVMSSGKNECGLWLSTSPRTERGEVAALADGDTHLRAPEADLGIVHAVNGAVFPFRGRGGVRGGVGVVWRGVEGEGDEA